jgi:hypothetical protein
MASKKQEKKKVIIDLESSEQSLEPDIPSTKKRLKAEVYIIDDDRQSLLL